VWKQQFPTHLDWVTIFDDVVQLISLDGAFDKQQLELAATSGSWIEPTIHRLLAIRPLALGNNRGNVLEEVCRLGTLLFLTSFWRILGQSPVHTATIARNLQLVLLNYKTEWHELKPLLAWTLYHAAVETADPALRSQFILMLAVAMSGMQIHGWEEFLAIVKSVLWVDSVVAGSDDLIREEVRQIIGDPPSAPAYEERPFEFYEGA
jgi:myo-inositol catabolism protein IolC